MPTNIIGIKNGNVLVPYTPGSNMPAGTIIAYTGSIAGFTSTTSDGTTLVHKDGWAVCNGASISQTTYAELYARLSTTWNTATNPLTGSAQSAPSSGFFRVPNLQGVFLRGVGDYSGADAYSTENDVALAAYKVDQSQGHKHQTELNVEYTGASTTFVFKNYGATSNTFTNNIYTSDVPITDGTNGTPRTGKETNPKQVGVNYLVKLYDNQAPVDVYIAPASASAAGLLSRYEEDTWTPTITSVSGTITSYTLNFAKYIKINNTVLVSVSVSITNKGSATGGLIVSLPNAALYPSTETPISGVENNATGQALIGRVRTSGSILIAKVDGGTPIVDTYTILVNGSYPLI